MPDYILLSVRNALTVHGYDEQNREIIEQHEPADFMPKLINTTRIQSVSEQYLLVTGAFGRMMYWEYQGSLDDVRRQLVPGSVKEVEGNTKAA
ncbi:MAG: hypothetical protein Q4D19_02280 [Lautropia sp.]|nr:hypothetical protein [Lautropia sp.]